LCQLASKLGRGFNRKDLGTNDHRGDARYGRG
jgi:hypothetical protein